MASRWDAERDRRGRGEVPAGRDTQHSGPRGSRDRLELGTLSERGGLLKSFRSLGEMSQPSESYLVLRTGPCLLAGF